MKKIVAFLLIATLILSCSCTKKDDEDAYLPSDEATNKESSDSSKADENNQNDSVDKEQNPQQNQKPEQEDKNEPIYDDSNANPASDFDYFKDNASGIVITKYKGTKNDVVIPNYIDGLPVASIALFCNETITSVVIPDTVKKIGVSAFENCDSLKEVVFGKGLIEIEFNAFKGCDSLKKVVLPPNLLKIGSRCFYECSSLEEVFINKNLTTWGESPFGFNKKLKAITFEDGIKQIGDDSFGGAFFNNPSLETVTIPSSVIAIESAAFSNCENLKSVYFEGDAPTSVGMYAFHKPAENNWEPVTLYYKPNAKGWNTTKLKDQYSLKAY